MAANAATEPKKSNENQEIGSKTVSTQDEEKQASAQLADYYNVPATMLEQLSQGTLTPEVSMVLYQMLVAHKQSHIDKTAQTVIDTLSAETTKFQAENVKLTAEIEGLHRDADKSRQVLLSLLESAQAVAVAYNDSAEIQSGLNRHTFTGHSEQSGKLDEIQQNEAINMLDDDLGNTTSQSKTACINQHIQKIGNLFAKEILAAVPETEKTPELVKSIEASVQDEGIIATGMENFEEIVKNLSVGSEDTAIQKQLEELSKHIFGQDSEKGDTQSSESSQYVRREIGHKQAIKAALERVDVVEVNGTQIPMKDFNKESLVEYYPELANVDWCFGGFKEKYSEVRMPEMKFADVHVFSPQFKVIMPEGTDMSQAKIDLSEQLGDKFIVDGAKKARLEQEAAKAALAADAEVIAEDLSDPVAIPNTNTTPDETLDRIPSANTVETSEKNTKKSSRTIFFHLASIPKFQRNAMIGASVLAMFLVMKFVMGVPTYRMVANGLFANFDVSMSVAENWSLWAFTNKLSYLLPYLQEMLLSQRYIHADETTLQVMRESGRDNTTKSYLWLYSTIADCPTQVRYFDYQPGRSGDFAAQMLMRWSGYLITDAYQGYNAVTSATHCFCMIHARRAFYAAACNSTIKSCRGKAASVVLMFDMLFHIESQLQDMSPEERLAARKSRMKPVLDVMIPYIEQLSKDPMVSKNSKLAKACNYFLSHKKELLKFLEDGNIPMHNMVAELAIKSVVIGRNNWLMCGSPNGAKALAGIYSIIETARANNLDVFKYLMYLFEHMHGNEFMNDEKLMRSLLPWSEEVQAACGQKHAKGQKKAA